MGVLVLSGCAQNKPLGPESGFTNPVATTGNDPYVIGHEEGFLTVESKKGGLWVTKSEPANLTGVFRSGNSTQVWSAPSTGANCRDVWAPELISLDDAWYIYYAATTCDGGNKNHRMFVLKADTPDPMGTYSDLGAVEMKDDFWAIDGTVLDHDGSRYFIWSGWAAQEDGQQNLYIAPMDSPTSLSAERTLLSEPTEDWERNAMPIQEGPQILTKDEALLIIYSASGSWTDDYAYGSLTFQGGEILDPGNWKKSESAIFAKTDEVTGVGHGSFVKSPDGSEDWMVYHASHVPGSGWDRVIRMQPFTWDGATPNFGVPAPPAEFLPFPSGEAKP